MCCVGLIQWFQIRKVYFVECHADTDVDKHEEPDTLNSCALHVQIPAEACLSKGNYVYCQESQTAKLVPQNYDDKVFPLSLPTSSPYLLKCQIQ